VGHPLHQRRSPSETRGASLAYLDPRTRSVAHDFTDTGMHSVLSLPMQAASLPVEPTHAEDSMPTRSRRPMSSRQQPMKFSDTAEDYAPSALRATPGWPRLFPRDVTERWRRQMGRFTNQPRGALVYPSPNGHFDPLSIAAVLDCILRLELGTYITGNNLAHELNRSYPQITWDPVTTGKILSDIAGFAAELKLPHEKYEQPFYVRKLGGGRHYLVHDDPHGWQWLGLVRDFMGREAERYIREGKYDRPIDVWTPVLAFKYGQRVGED
jgi:hypothetical protein